MRGEVIVSVVEGRHREVAQRAVQGPEQSSRPGLAQGGGNAGAEEDPGKLSRHGARIGRGVSQCLSELEDLMVQGGGRDRILGGCPSLRGGQDDAVAVRPHQGRQDRRARARPRQRPRRQGRRACGDWRGERSGPASAARRLPPYLTPPEAARPSGPRSASVQSRRTRRRP